MTDDFRQALVSFANKMTTVAPRCTNEESTKIFLILPFLSFLGYDDRNPNEVCPEHGADFSEKYKNRVDFAILKDEEPVIAIECKCSGTSLKDERGQLRSYFNAAKTVKMGILTDGLLYEFYADSDEPNMMDQTAFLSLDLREVAKGKLEESVVDGLKSLQKSSFDPENIGAEAKRKLIFQNLVQQLTSLSENPSEQFTRMLLQNANLSHVRAKALPEYQEMVRAAFREFTNIRILQRLDLPQKETEKAEKASQVAQTDGADNGPQPQTKTILTEVELDVFAYMKRRLAFLVKDENIFREIDNIEYRDYQGKFVVFYRRERKGRLFDFFEGGAPKYKFLFPDGIEVAGDDLGAIDAPLLSIFKRRLVEEGIISSD
ncbi:MAG: type I restriction endonuclease [Alphaproteobacteria bacterium]